MHQSSVDRSYDTVQYHTTPTLPAGHRDVMYAVVVSLSLLWLPTVLGFASIAISGQRFQHRNVLLASQILSRRVAALQTPPSPFPLQMSDEADAVDEEGLPQEDGDEEDVEGSLLSEDEEVSELLDLDSMEKAWRYAKKPLLRIGSKGATLTHGNSLKQLLEQHTVIKVKVNTRRFDNSLQQAFEQLRQLAEENGAPPGIELIQTREAENVIMFGWPGSMKRIQNGEFPPPPPPPWVPGERSDA